VRACARARVRVLKVTIPSALPKVREDCTTPFLGLEEDRHDPVNNGKVRAR